MQTVQFVCLFPSVHITRNSRPGPTVNLDWPEIEEGRFNPERLRQPSLWWLLPWSNIYVLHNQLNSACVINPICLSVAAWNAFIFFLLVSCVTAVFLWFYPAVSQWRTSCRGVTCTGSTLFVMCCQCRYAGFVCQLKCNWRKKTNNW